MDGGWGGGGGREERTRGSARYLCVCLRACVVVIACAPSLIHLY